jgi:prepilin-type processing-associated H-X9-DG protein
MQCTNNVKQLSLALHNCHDITGTFPSEVYAPAKGQTADRGVSCLMGIIRYIEQVNLESLISNYNVNITEEDGTVISVTADISNMTHQQTGALGKVKVPAFLCPSSTNTKPGTGNAQTAEDFIGNYMANAGAAESEMTASSLYKWDIANGFTSKAGPASTTQIGPWVTNGIIFYRSRIGFSDLIDGTSNTFAWSEISWNEYKGMIWTRSTGAMCYAKAFAETLPINLFRRGIDKTYNIKADTGISGGTMDANPVVIDSMNYGAWGSYHTGGINVGLCDGSVRFLSETIDMNILLGCACREDGETVALP